MSRLSRTDSTTATKTVSARVLQRAMGSVGEHGLVIGGCSGHNVTRMTRTPAARTKPWLGNLTPGHIGSAWIFRCAAMALCFLVSGISLADEPVTVRVFQLPTKRGNTPTEIAQYRVVE